jgi:hypothetical protein
MYTRSLKLTKVKTLIENKNVPRVYFIESFTFIFKKCLYAYFSVRIIQVLNCGVSISVVQSHFIQFDTLT